MRLTGYAMQFHARIINPTHLELDYASPFPPGTRVVVEFVSSDADLDEFAEASLLLLDRAYGDDEPNYSDTGIPITL